MIQTTVRGAPVDLTLVTTWPQAVVAVALIVAVIMWPSVASWLNSRSAKVAAASVAERVQQTQTTVTEVRDHVANTHTTNLREDLAGMADDIRTAVEVARETHALVADLAPRVTALERHQQQQARRRRLWRL